MRNTIVKRKYYRPDLELSCNYLELLFATSNTETIDDDENEIAW